MREQIGIKQKTNETAEKRCKAIQPTNEKVVIPIAP